ncbi:hypothetical protein ACHQM5_000333 [Ranunculus cassubicifolius]
MPLSFPLKSKPSSSTSVSPTNNLIHENNDSQSDSSQSSTEFITEFNQTLNPNSNLIIPPLQNTWKPYLSNLTTDFQDSSLSTTDSTSYGLNLRSKKVSLSNELEPYESLDMKLLQRLREDIRVLPEDKGLEEFVEVPVKGYGKAVLKGYGWSEGKGIGKNVKEDVEVVEYQRRSGRQGLGFVAPRD